MFSIAVMIGAVVFALTQSLLFFFLILFAVMLFAFCTYIGYTFLTMRRDSVEKGREARNPALDSRVEQPTLPFAREER